MEVFLYNSNICRLCGEENDNGTFLYSCDENNTNLSEVINTYLPIKVYDDEQLPRTICPGCTIQLEATVEFLTLIINGQKVIRELHFRETEYKKSIHNPASEQDVITEKIVYEVNTEHGIYQVEHPIALQIAGLDKPKRKRGRPPKKPKTPEELAAEAAAKEREQIHVKKSDGDAETTGKRRRKAPTRFKEAVQGKELERIFKEEGVTDGEESDRDLKHKVDMDMKLPITKEPEVIGHMENSGELVVFVKGKGRGRPKGPTRPTRKECAICGMEFSCTGRYMSHVAQHGPVIYQCGECNGNYETHLDFVNHQKELDHSGKNIIPITKKNVPKKEKMEETVTDEAVTNQPSVMETPDVGTNMLLDNVKTSLPDLSSPDITVKSELSSQKEINSSDMQVDARPVENIVIADDVSSIEQGMIQAGAASETSEAMTSPTGKVRLKCNQCDKTFSNKQSKSLHIKATHQGEKPYICSECGAKFAYPRSLALHAISHRRHRTNNVKGFACDLCGKVLNHPSSVVYHKEAEHAGQRYVCNKCGKSFKHKQLLQRHQIVHSQVRPYTCKTCNASFKTKANLLNHQLLHTGVKKFSCELCKHKFAHKTSLTLHMRWHTGHKPYACGTCGKSFSQKGNLAEHERIHTGEKPFQCALCPRRFTTSSQHRLHARRHAPDRPHVCTHCGKRFVSRSSWAAHVRREGSGRAHRCSACGRMFAERWSLLKHMRVHHPQHASQIHKHKKQIQKQVSLLATSQPQQQDQQIEETVMLTDNTTTKVELIEEESQEPLEERVIYVTYNVDEPDSPGYHILSPEQASTLEDNKTVQSCELFSGPSLLLPQTDLEHLELEQEDLEHLHEQLVLDDNENMPVTDEQGNPLHFTMQDGTRLAITSADGKSLQVITQDGQTIPVEINGYADEEEVESSDTIVHQLDLQKSGDTDMTAPVAHYFTIV